jgi:trk system potassium uptake protein TrkA
VSTPVRLAAAVDEALVTGDVVRLMSLQHGTGSIVEFTLPADSSLIGRSLGTLELPSDAVLLVVHRNAEVRPAGADLVLAAGDELVFLAGEGAEQGLRERLRRTP